MIGTTLKKLRNIYGLSATELSEKLSISNSYLSEIENNKKQPSLELLQRYSDIMGIKRSSLLLLSEEHEYAESHGDGQAFIVNLMRNLINTITPSSYEK